MQIRQEERRVLHSSLIRNCQKEYMNQHLDSNIKFRLQTVSKIEHLQEKKSREALLLKTVFILSLKNYTKVMVTEHHESHDYRLNPIWQFWSNIDGQRCWHHFNPEPSNSTLGCNFRGSAIIEDIRDNRHKLKHRKFLVNRR